MLRVGDQAIESLVRRGFDLCLDLVCVADFDGYFRMVNQAWEAELGYTREELVSRPYVEFVHPEDREATQQEAGRLEGGEPVWTFENRYRHRDGSYVWLSWRATPMPEHGSILAIARNVTERKRREAEAEREAAETRRTLETLFGNLPGMAYRCRNDADYTMEFVSPGCAELTGYAPQDLIGNRRVAYADLIHAKDLGAVQALVEAGVAGHEAFRLRYRIRTAHGEEKWVWEQGCGVYSESGDLVCLEGYMVDITTEQEAGERLREQAMLLEEANDAITVRSLDHTVTYWNAGAARLWGWAREEAVGRDARELLGQGEDAQYRAAVEATLGDGSWAGEFSQHTRDGRELAVAARWSLLRDAEGEPRAILSIADDQTEKKQLQEQLFRSQRLESIGTLASGIAHDLNNALAPILMGVQMLRRRESADPATLAIIESSALRGARFVKQVLTFGRGIEGDRIAIDVRGLIHDVAGVASRTFPPAIELSGESEDELWPVSADPVQVEQVLMNLLVNARDAMPDGGRIRVRCANVALDETYSRMHLDARAGEYVTVEVADTGCGMPPVVVERIFEPFFTTKETGSGTGLGLATVHTIVKNHGGFVHVYSEVDHGTTFRVYLPASPSEEIRGRALRPVAARGQGECILVVDDEAPVREMASLVLDGSGYRTEVAANGAEAVARYARGGVDAVVLDWAMPVMNGAAAAAAIRSLDAGARILVSSGLAERGELRNMDPVPPFLAKPYTADQLLEHLGRLFARAEDGDAPRGETGG